MLLKGEREKKREGAGQGKGVRIGTSGHEINTQMADHIQREFDGL